MGLVTPDYGTIFWMVLSFSIVLFVLKKFAWPAILSGLKDRETSISEALKSAERAKEDMQRLKANNEKIMKEAKQERDQFLSEARDVKNKMIESAKIEAKGVMQKMIEEAKLNIETEKLTAINKIKEQVADLSIEISEKILKRELSKENNQKELIDSMLREFKLN